MTISFTNPTYYDFSVMWGATDICSTAPSGLGLSTRNINPENLHDANIKHEEADIPEGDGALDLSDGHYTASTINFFGAQYASDPDDLFSDLAAKINTILGASQYRYLKAGLYDGSTKQYVRKYGKFLGATAGYQRKTQYDITSTFQMAFRALDPFWYQDTVKTQSITTNSGSTITTQGTTDTGIDRSKRLLIKITRTGAGVPTNPQIKNAANQSFTLTGTLAATSDYWLIDMMNCTVIKATSGGTVLADDIASFSGRFWGIAPSADTITVTNGVNAAFNVTLTWLPRMS